MLQTDLDMAYTAIRRQLSLPSTQAFHPVHRLDRLTTGCLLLPTSSSFARDISNQISSRQVQKSYLALVRGGKQSFEKKSGVIDLGLHVDTHGRMRVGRPGGSVKGGEKETIMPARTNWEVIAHSVGPFRASLDAII
jgi:23S rRNA-/tRNA-specific pseudouridylate synthase